MAGLLFGRHLAQRLDASRARLLVTGRNGGAVPAGESSRVHLLRCTALDVPEHAFAPCAAPCALHMHPPELVRNAGYRSEKYGWIWMKLNISSWPMEPPGSASLGQSLTVRSAVVPIARNTRQT